MRSRMLRCCIFLDIVWGWSDLRDVRERSSSELFNQEFVLSVELLIHAKIPQQPDSDNGYSQYEQRRHACDA
jgi:hypothetical protein